MENNPAGILICPQAVREELEKSEDYAAFSMAIFTTPLESRRMVAANS